jgi:hypothetical protein
LTRHIEFDVNGTNRLNTLTYPGGGTANYIYFPDLRDKRLQEILILVDG